MEGNKLPVRLLREELKKAQTHVRIVRTHTARGTMIEVAATGHKLSTAYEQLRNVAEYAEEHLLLQRAIRRFYRRSINFYTLQHLAKIGEELITELTLASYIPNRTYGMSAARALDQLVKHHLGTYQQLIKARAPRDTAAAWILDLLAVETEGLLNPHSHYDAFITFAYEHYLGLLPRKAFTASRRERQDYETALYVAVHQALLKSDAAVVRHELLRTFRQDSRDARGFIRFNHMVNRLYVSPQTQRLNRVIGKYGAPMRILKNLIESRPDMLELLGDRQAFLDAYDIQIRQEYQQARRRLNKGLSRSIAFIFITKVLVGVAVEIPYDLLMAGSVAMLPLTINIAFPPLYMAALKLGLKPPSLNNASALRYYIEQAVYTHESPLTRPLRVAPHATSPASRVLYGVVFLVPFAIIISVLSLLDFNIVQGAIFFLFLCTASFLGFRLSRMVSELELVTKQSGFVEATRDFFYLPFIIAGQWVSGKYAQVNVVAFVLDMAIELPLKTILRLARQWITFVNEKRENL